MGKKRIVTTGGGAPGQTEEGLGGLKFAKKRISSGRVYIQATYNNTLMKITDSGRNTITLSFFIPLNSEKNINPAPAFGHFA